MAEEKKVLLNIGFNYQDLLGLSASITDMDKVVNLYGDSTAKTAHVIAMTPEEADAIAHVLQTFAEATREVNAAYNIAVSFIDKMEG